MPGSARSPTPAAITRTPADPGGQLPGRPARAGADLQDVVVCSSPVPYLAGAECLDRFAGVRDRAR